jgi:hypothetical protein
MLIVMGDFNAKIGEEAYQKQVAGMEGCWESLQLGIICSLQAQFTLTNIYTWKYGRLLGSMK